MGLRSGSLVGDSITLGFKHLHRNILSDIHQLIDVTILDQNFAPIAVIPASSITRLSLGYYQVIAPGNLFPSSGTYYDVWKFRPVPDSSIRSLRFSISVVNSLAPPPVNIQQVVNGCTLNELDACLLKSKYLVSVEPSLNGYYLTDSFLQHHIDVAISKTQSDLGMPLQNMRVLTAPYSRYGPQSPVKGTDYDEDGDLLQWTGTTGAWGMIRLPHTGILKVNGLRGIFGGKIVYEVPLNWIERNQLKGGFVQIRPTTVGALNNLIDSSGQFLDATLLESIGNMTVPGFWAVDYWYSGGNTNADGTFPKEICDIIMKRAAVKVLTDLSIAITRGIASRSASVDGLSSSINFLASVDRGIFSSLAAQYEQDLTPEALLDLRRKHKSIMISFF